jgi:hypothetical protein
MLIGSSPRCAAPISKMVISIRSSHVIDIIIRGIINSDYKNNAVYVFGECKINILYRHYSAVQLALF